ncbi:MAG TPA: aminopeptidase P N-terminal domain-containing protein [Polyangia bacterium]
MSTDYAQRRRALLERLGPRGAALVPGAPRAHATRDARFHQDGDVLYLTGFPEPDTVALVTAVHPEHRFVLFVPPRDPKLETWTGMRAGVEGARERYGADAAYPINELDERLPEYLANVEDLTYPLGRDPELDRRVLAVIAGLAIKERQRQTRPARICAPRISLHELRLVKDAAEIATLRLAVAATADGHAAAAVRARPGAREHEVRAELERGFLLTRGVPGYPSIVAAGEHATVLHYEGEDGELREGELCLIDAGAAVDGYVCDVSRTFPVGGRFTAGHRRLYEVVLEAEEAAIAAVTPGATVDGVHAVAVEVLVRGLVRLGLLAGDPAELITSKAYERFYMHRTSHWLGLDTHDVGSYLEGGEPRPLRPGMVLTVEPGLYVARADDVAPAYAGAGIRVEDDVLVTAQGAEVLTRAIPKSADQVERMVRG